jgi:hypothetical protein
MDKITRIRILTKYSRYQFAPQAHGINLVLINGVVCKKMIKDPLITLSKGNLSSSLITVRVGVLSF